MVCVRRIQQQATQSRYYNRGAKQLQPLRVEDQVHFQTSYGPKPGSLLQSWNYRRYPPPPLLPAHVIPQKQEIPYLSPSGSVQQPDLPSVQEHHDD